MNIYTRTGDDGTTSLAGGERVPKHDPRIEAYGTVDELIGWIGLLRSISENSKRADLLIAIQEKLMHCAALLAAGKGAQTDRMKAPDASDIQLLEHAIDGMQQSLEPLDSFILPGGQQAASFANIARTVCRRAERAIVKPGAVNGRVDSMIVKYINRLSDYLFVLGRTLTHENGYPETRWAP